MSTPVLKLPHRAAAPAHLSTEATDIWSATVRAFVFAPHELVTLRAALEAWDRADTARRFLDEHGTTFEDRFGQPKNRPETMVELHNRAAFLRAWKALDLPTDDGGPSNTSLMPR